MQGYLDLLHHLRTQGVETTDRTGTGTYADFGGSLAFDLAHGFPLLTTKRLHWKSIVAELLWFLRGETNIKTLDAKIWDEWADENGDLGPVYGKQWRNFGGIDQIQWLVDEIKARPDSRRLVVSAWNPPEIQQMALPPCHTMFQVKILDNRLHLQLYQRSADVFLGVPFNIASYALLTHMLAHVTGYQPGMFIHSLGDVHIYKNHLDQVDEQLRRRPTQLPELHLNSEITSIFDFKPEDITLHGYTAQPSIKAPVAV